MNHESHYNFHFTLLLNLLGLPGHNGSHRLVWDLNIKVEYIWIWTKELDL